jgi:hypothetical protein
MSTARIGIKVSDDAIVGILIYSDPGPKQIGRELLSEINTETKVKEMIAGGDLLNMSGSAFPDSRPWKDRAPLLFDSESGFCDYYGVAFSYLFKDNQWFVCTAPGSPRKLTEKMCGLARATANA